MKRNAILILLFSFLFCLIESCEKEKKFAQFTTDYENYAFNDSGESISIKVSANSEWSINTIADWLSISPSKGSGDALVTITSNLNKTGKDRSGVITICPNVSTSDISSLSVSQKAAVLNFIKSGKINFDSAGGDEKIEIKSSVEWEIKSETGVDWLSISPKSGMKDEIITVSTLNNATSNERFAKLILNCKIDPSWADTVEIFQKKNTNIVDGSYTKYMKSSKSKPARLIVMGDGYDINDINKTKKYDRELNEAIDAIFSVEPYSTYKNYFEVFKIYAVSKDSGISDDEKGIDKKTKFSSTFENGVMINTDYQKVFEYAMKIPGITDAELKNTAILLILNADKYAGVCYMFGDGKSIALCPVSRWGNKEDMTYFNSIVLHEAGGHGWGQLADEYVLGENSGKTIPQDEIDNLIKIQKESKMYLNVTSDKTNVPWKNFIDRNGYENVGLFEGGYYWTYGIWRCEKENCMINNIHYYSAFCRYLQVKRIMDIVGEDFNIEKFIEKDVVKKPSSFTKSPLVLKDIVPLHKPVFIK